MESDCEMIRPEHVIHAMKVYECYYHTTSRLFWIYDFTPFEHPGEPIYDGTNYQWALGIGNMWASFKGDLFVLKVFYIPQREGNFISLRKLLGKGAIVNKNEDALTIRKAGQPVLVARPYTSNEWSLRLTIDLQIGKLDRVMVNTPSNKFHQHFGDKTLTDILKEAEAREEKGLRLEFRPKDLDCITCRLGDCKLWHEGSKWLSVDEEEEPEQALVAADSSNDINKGVTEWVIDSGASSHMTPSKDLLKKYIELEVRTNIHLGNGDIVSAIGKGDNSFFDLAGNQAELRDVLLVPELKMNLFSVNRTMKLGNSILFNSENMRVEIRREGIPTLRGKSIGKLFKIELPTIIWGDREQALLGTTLNEWHRRFAHMGKDSIKNMSNRNIVNGLKIENHKTDRCADCAYGKICRTPHTRDRKQAGNENCLVIHADTVAINESSLGGSKYYVLYIDENSGYMHISFAALKSEIPNMVKQVLNQNELETKKLVYQLRTDNGTEFINHNLGNWIQNKGISHITSTPYVPEQNGMVERANRVVNEWARTQLVASGLDHSLWAEAANYVVYTVNRMISSRDPNKTRFELYYGSKPNIGNLRVFGQIAIAKLPKVRREHKLSPLGKQYRMVGYTDKFNTHRLYDEDQKSITISCDVQFLDDTVVGRRDSSQHVSN